MVIIFNVTDTLMKDCGDSRMTDGQENALYIPPKIGSAQLKLLERLCNACAVSGDESEVRTIVLEQIRETIHKNPEVESEIKITTDHLGNVLVSRQGWLPNRLRVMVAAHMDEVGFMLTHDEEDGIFRFEAVGGVDERQLAGKPVLVGKDRVPGVIGAKPIHLTTSDERKHNISIDSLRIDLGPGNGGKAKIGDRATFATSFSRMGPSIRAKALDDRLGVATLIELIKHSPPTIDLLAAFTVQEEIGLRGATVAAYALDPQLAFVLDATPANDLPAWDPVEDGDNQHYNTRLSDGPAIYLADRMVFSDPRLIRHVSDTAEQLKIPYQFRQPGGGTTDAGTIHKQRSGIPSISISVPARYTHTAASISRLSDWQNTLALVHAALTNLTPEVLQPLE
jgi:tetrahedral aminopeptidase